MLKNKKLLKNEVPKEVKHHKYTNHQCGKPSKLKPLNVANFQLGPLNVNPPWTHL
jgi:hypothetical protein